MARRRKDTSTLAYRLRYGKPAGEKKKKKRKKSSTRAKSGASAKTSAKSRRKMKKNQVIATILMISSVLLLLYPIVATNYNNKRLSNLSDTYKDKVNVSPIADTNAEELAKAREYNDWLDKNRFTPPPIGEDHSHKDYERYDKLLSEPDGTMGTITIPSIDVDLPIYHGTSEEVLYKGAGHLYGTYLPVGGNGRTAAISAHTGMVNASMFDNLPKMQLGDLAIVQVRDQKLAYKMVESKVVPPVDDDAIPFDDRDLLVLITCTPYGINSDRLIVTLERTELPADVEQVENKVRSWQWWMTAVLILSFILLFTFFMLLRSELDKAKNGEGAKKKKKKKARRK